VSPGRDDERDDRDERPRRSWREIDRMRDRPSERRDASSPGPGASQRSAAATQRYLRKLDGLFSEKKGGAEDQRLAEAVRAAHGTRDLAAACRAYLDALGPPRDPALAALFLDCGVLDLVRAALETLAEGVRSGAFGVAPGMRSQLRLLSESPDDDVAGLAEELLAGG
jgi:hypothetical protein